MSDAELLRVIANGGYSPEMDHDGSTQRRLLAIADALDQKHRPSTSWPESDGQ